MNKAQPQKDLQLKRNLFRGILYLILRYSEIAAFLGSRHRVSPFVVNSSSDINIPSDIVVYNDNGNSVIGEIVELAKWGKTSQRGLTGWSEEIQLGHQLKRNAN